MNVPYPYPGDGVNPWQTWPTPDTGKSWTSTGTGLDYDIRRIAIFDADTLVRLSKVIHFDPNGSIEDHAEVYAEFVDIQDLFHQGRDLKKQIAKYKDLQTAAESLKNIHDFTDDITDWNLTIRDLNKDFLKAEAKFVEYLEAYGFLVEGYSKPRFQMPNVTIQWNNNVISGTEHYNL